MTGKEKNGREGEDGQWEKEANRGGKRGTGEKGNWVNEGRISFCLTTSRADPGEGGGPPPPYFGKVSFIF